MCGGVRGAPLQDRHALHVLLHAIEEVVHVSFVRQAEAPALALQVPLVGLGAQHIARGLDPPRWSSEAIAASAVLASFGKSLFPQREEPGSEPGNSLVRPDGHM